MNNINEKQKHICTKGIHISPGMCSSRKNPYPPHGRSLEIPRGRGGGS